ncbi:hypothetical protein J7K70_00085 [bacterium]|nr:hypothetical protein [bacterium]
MVDRISQTAPTPILDIIVETNVNNLLTTIEECLTSKVYYQSLAPLSKSNAIRLSKMHLRNRFATGGKTDGCPAWASNSPATLDWESEQPGHAPDYTLPLVFTGRARSMIAPIVGRFRVAGGYKTVPIYSETGGDYTVSNTGYVIRGTFIFPKYMVYHQYGYTTTWRGKKREVPARPWFLWASVNFDGAGFNLFRRIARRIVLDHASTLFAFIKRRLGGKLMSLSGRSVKNA